MPVCFEFIEENLLGHKMLRPPKQGYLKKMLPNEYIGGCCNDAFNCYFIQEFLRSIGGTLLWPSQAFHFFCIY